MTRTRGFSLIELMIAVTLGMLAVAAVGSVFIYGSRNYKQDDRLSRMQDELRFAMAQVTLDIEMAGFWAQVTNPVQSVSVDGGLNVNCGPTTDGGANSAVNNWVFNERRSSLMTVGNATASQATARFPCIPAENFVPGTDVLGIIRLSGTDVAATEDNKFYVRTNGVQTTLYRDDNGVHGPGAPVTIYEFKPAVWYVRNFTNTGDTLPCLTRATPQWDSAGGAVVMSHQCVAAGIENMQLEFGFDNDGNGVADQFVQYDAGATPTADQLANVVGVRIHVLARSQEPDPDTAYVNDKTYQLGSTAVVASDRYYRRTLSSLVLVRNQGYRRSPFALPSS